MVFSVSVATIKALSTYKNKNKTKRGGGLLLRIKMIGMGGGMGAVVVRIMVVCTWGKGVNKLILVCEFFSFLLNY